MGGGTEAKEADAVARLDSGDTQAAKADDSGAQQRRGVQIVERIGQWKHEVGARGGELGISAIDRIAGKGGRIAKILPASRAIRAGAVDSADPGHSDPGPERQILVCAIHNLADDLMAGDQRVAQRRQFAGHDVQVRATNAAGSHAKQNVARLRFRLRYFFEVQDFPGSAENSGPHKSIRRDSAAKMLFSL